MSIVDAFTERPFAGNPAAVCRLPEPRDSAWMQAVAAEMNLSETAFVRSLPGGGYALRWFTPEVEVDLCGHATLATAHVLWECGDAPRTDDLRFDTASGPLTATLSHGAIELDFPATPAERCPPPAGLLEALGLEGAEWFGRSRFDVLVDVGAEEVVRGIEPDFAALRSVDVRGIMVTAPSGDQAFHFVSRFFAPREGIDEDPVTGSAHCCLGPYWGERLKHDELVGYQASARGGVVRVRLAGDRVLLGGRAVTVVEGILLA